MFSLVQKAFRQIWPTHEPASDPVVAYETQTTEEEPKMSSEGDKALNNNNVGPIVRAGDMAQAVIDTAEVDNPGKEIRVFDKIAYVRIETDGELRLTRETMEEQLGRPFEMRELEINLASFAGQIESTEDFVRFYYDKTM